MTECWVVLIVVSVQICRDEADIICPELFLVQAALHFTHSLGVGVTLVRRMRHTHTIEGIRMMVTYWRSCSEIGY